MVIKRIKSNIFRKREKSARNITFFSGTWIARTSVNRETNRLQPFYCYIPISYVKHTFLFQMFQVSKMHFLPKILKVLFWLATASLMKTGDIFHHRLCIGHFLFHHEIVPMQKEYTLQSPHTSALFKRRHDALLCNYLIPAMRQAVIIMRLTVTVALYKVFSQTVF